MKNEKIKVSRKRIFEIIQIGNKSDIPSKIFDIFIVIMIFLCLFVTFFETFEEAQPFMDLLKFIEMITCIVFAIEYSLRVWTADYLYPLKTKAMARISFIFSFFGLIDLITFLPFFLPIFFPSGIVAFKMFRVVRIFRLFRINAKYDAFNVIVDVLYEKKNQIISSVFIVIVLMLASSLCMYSLEHEIQPKQFSNAFSGMWWSMSTLLTVGYGDIYPVTFFGKIFAIIIAFLGVGVVAIPTGIISAGFVEHYTRIRSMEVYADFRNIKFITAEIEENHPWIGQTLNSIVFPPKLMPALVIRNEEPIIPLPDMVLECDDKVVIASKNFKNDSEVLLKEIDIKDENPWIGKDIKDLDISRLDYIVMIRRKNKLLIANPTINIRQDDSVIMYSRTRKE